MFEPKSIVQTHQNLINSIPGIDIVQKELIVQIKRGFFLDLLEKHLFTCVFIFRKIQIKISEKNEKKIRKL